MVRGLEEAGGMPDSRGSSPVRGAPVQLPQVKFFSTGPPDDPNLRLLQGPAGWVSFQFALLKTISGRNMSGNDDFYLLYL